MGFRYESLLEDDRAAFGERELSTDRGRAGFGQASADLVPGEDTGELELTALVVASRGLQFCNHGIAQKRGERASTASLELRPPNRQGVILHSRRCREGTDSELYALLQQQA